MFGMGTGGSLRLLSPETCCARPFCCRLPVIVSSAIERPPDFLQFSFAFGLRTFELLRARLSARASAPSKPHRPELPLRPTKTSLLSPSKLLPSLYTNLTGFELGPGFVPCFLSVRSRWTLLPPFPAFNSQFSFPFSQFLLRSSPRPISIIKLHTLPHFHR